MSELNFNVFNIIIISGVIYGIIFSVVITTEHRYRTNNTLYLALVVLFLSLSNFQYWLLDTGLIYRHPLIEYIYIPWHWLVVPMFYLYVQKFIGKTKITVKLKMFLLLPFFIVLFIHIGQVFYKLIWNEFYEIPSHFKRGLFVYLEFLSVIFNVLVMFLTFNLIKKHENDKTYAIERVKSETNWLKKLIYTGLIICLCWLVAIIIVVVFNLDESYIFYPMWLGISFLVYWIGHVGLNKSGKLSARIELRKQRMDRIYRNVINPKKDSDSFMNIEIFIKKEKAYLNPNLGISTIAKELNISEGYVSQLINKNSDYNFNDYINNLRINEAKEMLDDNTYENYTIVAIGLEAGFNSKSSFYSAFKKFTGHTPNEYKKSVRNS